MRRSDFKRRSLPVVALALAALLGAGALTACGQGSSSTNVVLTGPPDKVDALIAQHKLLGSPVQAQMEKLEDGRERARFHLSKGLPMSEVIALGQDAAKVGASYEFSSGTQWDSGTPGDAGAASPPAKKAGPIV